MQKVTFVAGAFSLEPHASEPKCRNVRTHACFVGFELYTIREYPAHAHTHNSWRRDHKDQMQNCKHRAQRVTKRQTREEGEWTEK